MTDFPIDERNKVRRKAHRATYNREAVYRIIDETLYCNVGFVEDGLPYVIPTNHARMGDTLIFHGSRAGNKLKVIGAGAPLCVTFSLLDGLVMTKSATDHAVNYRSAIVFGKGRAVEERDEKIAALHALIEHVMPGRWDDSVPPSENELLATAVVAIDIETASGKIRNDPPGPTELTEPIWEGILPVRQQILEPIPAPEQDPNVPVPDYILNYWRAK